MLLASFLALSATAQAEKVRDCVLEGTLQKQAAEAGKVYVAFHSARPAEQGAKCRIRRNEKLEFKAPGRSELTDAEPGARVEYRYTEDNEKGATWKLRDVSR